ncbi:leucine--tRNA ligase [Candidatus Woesearchaeota archaeon]|nr:leucine--tRNA ligase [Candidatus Woesearchaeota archaeon]
MAIDINLKEIEKKWQTRWELDKAFEANPDKRKKFFLNFPYPYINAYQHIGHLFTLMRVEAFARYKRHRGFNVLFPQGWHATGSPIVNAAKRVKDREEKQIKIMKDMGFSDEDIKKFEKPEYWIEFFIPEFTHDYKRMGMSIDWRRSFHTTSLNPHYDRFIQWQFRKLKELGYVIKGKFPVVWDPKQQCAVGDHDRVEGEGEVPQEFCLFKFRLDDGNMIITATLRPDTVMGITNVYVNPKEKYSVVDVKGEKWIIGKPMIQKLRMQDFNVKEIGEVEGKSLVGQTVETYSGQKVPVFPATFLDTHYGTGMVHSVPSDSADDLIALRDLQKDESAIKKYGLDADMVKAVKPIPIFKTPGLSELPADDFLKKYSVKSQNERAKLEKIKKELYTLTFNKAAFNEKYKKGFSKNLSGVLVKDGQELIKRELLDKGAIDKFFELTGKVVSRSLTECVVKIVDDQWFIDYNNPKWKELAHNCLNDMKLYPEKARTQFDYVIDWLHEWACTREEGLGTRLPWDDKWLIESLSDSTIYMAYYTIVHLLQELPVEKVDDALFDYIFLGNGKKPDVENVDEMKRHFEYFYPVDFRNSGKDLIQNHLTFFIFNHVAIFPEDKWPKAIGANGWVTVDGQKMSKSLGNMIPVRKMAEEFTADATRITILNGGEEMDDPNWDTNFAKSIGGKLALLYEFCTENYGKHKRTEKMQIDAWFESELNRTIQQATFAMELTLFRTGIQKIYFEMQRILRHYMKRTNNNPHKELIDRFIEAQLVMLAPFTPHICEETWEAIGKKHIISNADWPEFDESKVDDALNIKENYFGQILSDVRTVKELAKLDKISKIQIFVSEQWKKKFFDIVKAEIDAGNRDFKEILGKVMADSELKKNGKTITKMLPNLLKKGLPEYLSADEEIKMLKSSEDAIKAEFGCEVSIAKAQDSEEAKAKQAMPGKPAIIVS